MQSEKSSVKGCLLLLLTAFIWGTAFIAQSKGMDRINEEIAMSGINDVQLG